MDENIKFNPFSPYGYDNDSWLKPKSYIIGISADEKMLTFSDGEISSVIKLDEEKGILSLLGVDGALLTSVELPNAQMIKSAYFDKISSEIVIVIELADGSLKEVRFNVDLSNYSTKDYTDKSKMDAIQASTNNAVTISNASKQEAINESVAISTNLVNQAKQEAIATSTNNSIDIANQAKQDAISASSIDASTKSNKAYDDAKGLIDIEVVRATSKEIELKNEIDLKVNTVELISDINNSMLYRLMVDGLEMGEINIPVNQFLKSATYDSANKLLVFIFNTDSGQITTNVDIADLVDTYTAGNGLIENKNKFSIFIDQTSENYLTVTSNGLKISGIENSLNQLKNEIKIDVDAVNKSLTNEISRATDAENLISSSFDTYKTSNKKYVDDSLALKQDKLISSNNIKTINGESLLGGGNIIVQNQNTIGDIKMSVINSNHDGWLVCDGSSVSRTMYSELFNLIGTKFGVGDNSTTFNLPNMVGNVPSMPSQNDALGEKIGTTEHVINKQNLPNYNLSVSNVGGETYTTSSSGTHSHSQTNDALKKGWATASEWGSSGRLAVPVCRNIRAENRDGQYDNILLYHDNGNYDRQGDTDWLEYSRDAIITINDSGSHTHTIATSNHTHTVSIDGGNVPISNYQPTLNLCNYFIFGGII